jgi:hypothetical protein
MIDPETGVIGLDIVAQPGKAVSLACMGYRDTLVVDASAGDVTVTTLDSKWANCRYISADVAGIIKIDYLDATGQTETEVLQLNAGELRPVRCVSKVYKQYKAATDCTAQCYGTDGELDNPGIKLHR